MIDASIALLKCVIDYGLCIWAFSWFAKRKSENRALFLGSMDRLSYDKEEVKAFLAEMDLNGISIFNVGSNTVTLASGWDLMAFIRQMISPENGGDAQ